MASKSKSKSRSKQKSRSRSKVASKSNARAIVAEVSPGNWLIAGVSLIAYLAFVFAIFIVPYRRLLTITTQWSFTYHVLAWIGLLIVTFFIAGPITQNVGGLIRDQIGDSPSFRVLAVLLCLGLLVYWVNGMLSGSLQLDWESLPYVGFNRFWSVLLMLNFFKFLLRLRYDA